MKCKAMVSSGAWREHRCCRNATKDGYCKQHHPDEVEKRKSAIEERQKKKLLNSPHRVNRDLVEKCRALKSLLEQALPLLNEYHSIQFAKAKSIGGEASQKVFDVEDLIEKIENL